MKKFLKNLLAAAVAVIALAFAACGGIFEGNIGISDNDKTKRKMPFVCCTKQMILSKTVTK